jgi:hypothetical protein
VPNRWQFLNFFFLLSTHLRVLSIRVHRWFIGKIKCFEIVSKYSVLDARYVPRIEN